MELAACLDHDKYFAKYSGNNGNCGFFILFICVNREVERERERERDEERKMKRDKNER